jgi:hypothetical protein
MTTITPNSYAWDQLILHDATLRRSYLLMLAERRAAIVAQAFAAAGTIEKLEHSRGGVAVLDDLANSFEREQRYASRRPDVERTG